MNLSWQLIAFEVFNFCLLLAILGRFLYRPLRETLQERRTELERSRTELTASADKAAQARAEFETRRRELEQEADALRLEGRNRGEAAAEMLIAEAREEVRTSRDLFQAELAQAEKLALEELRPRLLELSVEAAQRVVAGLELPEVATAYARLGGQRLKALADGELGAIEVRVSPDADSAKVRDVLHEALGPDCELGLSADSSLVGGVRLQHGDLEIESSAGACLEGWLDALPTSPSRLEPRA